MPTTLTTAPPTRTALPQPPAMIEHFSVSRSVEVPGRKMGYELYGQAVDGQPTGVEWMTVDDQPSVKKKPVIHAGFAQEQGAEALIQAWENEEAQHPVPVLSVAMGQVEAFRKHLDRMLNAFRQHSQELPIGDLTTDAPEGAASSAEPKPPLAKMPAKPAQHPAPSPQPRLNQVA